LANGPTSELFHLRRPAPDSEKVEAKQQKTHKSTAARKHVVVFLEARVKEIEAKH
jgi:hypothetical protein